jgi:hypothetical protein
MNLQQLQRELSKLRDQGYVLSLRKGPTGIGYTLERALNLKENNVAIPDVGGGVELKASRRNASSLITLFTFNRGVWQIPQKTVIQNYGYQDESGRSALYNLVRVGEINTQGLTLRIDEKNNEVHLMHESSRTLIAAWSVYTIVGKFLNKTERLLLVLADSQLRADKKEEFHFNEAYLLTDPKPQNFIEAFKKGSIVIDIRMHLKPNEMVRNHGTGFRIREIDIPLLYATRRNLI